MHTSSSHLSGWENLGFCEIELDSEDFWVCFVLINSRFLQEILSLSSCFCNKNELKANFCVFIMRLNLTHTANYDIIHAISLHVRMQSMKNALDNNFFPHLARERERENACLLSIPRLPIRYGLDLKVFFGRGFVCEPIFGGVDEEREEREKRLSIRKGKCIGLILR